MIDADTEQDNDPQNGHQGQDAPCLFPDAAIFFLCFFHKKTPNYGPGLNYMFFIAYPFGCIKRCLPSNTSSLSTWSSSGTQQSTGQTAAHWGSS